MARKKTNSQKARERRAAEEREHSGGASLEETASSEQELVDDGRALDTRKRTTVLVLVGLGLLFIVGLFVAERILRDDDSSETPSIEAAASPVGNTAVARDADLAARCWPNGGPVPGNATDAAQPPAMALDSTMDYSAIVTTNYGSFTIEFKPDEAPNTVNNFVCLANSDYYDALSPCHARVHVSGWRSTRHRNRRSRLPVRR